MPDRSGQREPVPYLPDDTLHVEKINFQPLADGTGSVRIQVIGSVLGEEGFPRELRSLNIRGFVLGPHQLLELGKMLANHVPTEQQYLEDVGLYNKRAVPPRQ